MPEILNVSSTNHHIPQGHIERAGFSEQHAEFLARKGVRTLIGDGESTIWKGEAFHVWGDMIGAGKLLRKATNGAMTTNGDAFNGTLVQRLPIAAPTDDMIARVDNTFASSITEGVEPTVKLLQDLGIEFQIVSGGWIDTMGGIKERLGVPIHANKLVRGRNGRHMFFEDQSLLAQNKSKQLYVDSVRQDLKPPIGVLGDGGTDMKIQADLKILITQHSGPRPPEIEEMADVVIITFAASLPLILGEERWSAARYNRNPKMRKLFEIGALSILSGQGVKFVNKAYRRQVIERLQRFMNLNIDRNAVPINSRVGLVYAYG